MSGKSNKPLLEVKNLKTYFHSDSGTVKAVDDVSFFVNEGETLGIVGESGCGKSISSMSILRLVETPPGKYEGGEILFEGQDMLTISDDEMRKVRGNKISFIFQEPMTSLNPIFKIGDQLSETMILHRGMSKKEAWEESIRLLDLVRIPNPERVVGEYPFALSGGMRQRAMIAMSLACEPKLLIADEPTTALDVTIQAQVLDLMNDLKKKINASIIFITHDLGVIAEMSDRVMVMYAGKVVETASVQDIFLNPSHPYTIGLINSKPDMSTSSDRLHVIPGGVPDLSQKPSGCPFHPRCDKVTDKCTKEFPPETAISDQHKVFCWACQGKQEEGSKWQKH
ncbi:ABC transporter ATP-binding protein [Ruminococcaceae bacterium OttesenSCG-928-L11]|nr:ABC transporter ATP-binding protein [Ruminococcaceae bacterium OttesenSCG-928-L11]